MPGLRRFVRIQALCVARGHCSFSDATDAVFHRARARGVMHLPTDLIGEMEVWIASTILRTIDDIESRPEAGREIVDEWLGPEFPPPSSREPACQATT